jgi:hypothetical protein
MHVSPPLTVLEVVVLGDGHIIGTSFSSPRLEHVWNKYKDPKSGNQRSDLGPSDDNLWQPWKCYECNSCQYPRLRRD